MKKFLLGFLAVFSVFALTGCKTKTEDYGAMKSFSFNYGGYNSGYKKYSITVTGSDVYYRATGANGVDLDVIKKIDSSYIEKIQKIINKYHVSEWDGFDERDDSVLDGNSFSLNIEYASKVITASGYMKYPKNFDKVKEELSKVFAEIESAKSENELNFKLYNNSSTGYSWKSELSEEGIVNLSSYYDNNGCGDLAGCGGYNVYTVKGLKPGKVTLSLTYSFVDPDKYDSYTAVYEITVNDDLTISETHSGSYFGSFYDKQ